MNRSDRPAKPHMPLKQRAALLRAKYAPTPAVTASKPQHINRFEHIALGTDDDGRLIAAAERPRLEHMHVLGATGSGKSTFLLNCILQDITRGRGVCVLDPHGGHPDSLINTVLRFLRDHNFLATNKIHIIAPNIREHVVGFDPLAPLPDTDFSVIADALLEAFERAWGDEDTHQKPSIRSVLKATFTALSECGLALADAKLLYQRDDPHGLRKSIIAKLENEYSHDELERLEQLASDPKLSREFEANVIGPINRLNEFVSSESLRTMFSMKRAHGDNTIDLLNVMEKGHIVLVDLQHQRGVSKANTDLLGKLIVRYLFLLLNYRENLEPFFLYIDECHRYLTKDIEDLLAESRKYGLGAVLAHQRLRQLGEANDALREAVMESTEIKAVFRLNSPQDAQIMAEATIPLTLEMPVAASIRPVVVGHTIGRLGNETYSVHESEGEGQSATVSQSYARGRTEMETWAHMVAHGVAQGSGTGFGEASGSGTASGINTVDSSSGSLAYVYDPNTGTMMSTPISSVSIGAVQGTAIADITSNSFQRSESSNRFDTQGTSDTVADSVGGGTAISEAVSNGKAIGNSTNRMRGTTQGAGSSEAMIPTYERLPTAWHSKENELYRAGEMIRGLPVGRAVLRFRGNTTFLNVPPPRRSKKP